MTAPKYLDYIGTPLEALADMEKQNSLRVLSLAVCIVGEYMENHPGYKGVDIRLVTIQFWSQLHGIISLNNSGTLIEADENTDQIIRGILYNMEIIIKRGLK